MYYNTSKYITNKGSLMIKINKTRYQYDYIKYKEVQRV